MLLARRININNISAKSEVSPALEQVNPNFLSNIYILNKDFSFKKKQGDDSLSITRIKYWTCVVTDGRLFCELERYCFFMTIIIKVLPESELGSSLQFATV